MVEHKLIYLARRNPALTAEQFPQAWRAHSQFAASFGQAFRQYFKESNQCAKVQGGNLPGSFANAYDGATLLTMVSREGLLTARYQPGTVEALRKDEERVFAAHVDDWTMGAEEHLLKSGPKGEAVILSFLYPTAENFALASRQQAEWLAALPSVATATRVAWNEVVDRSKAYGFGAVLEVWFASSDDASTAALDLELVHSLEQADIADPTRGARLVAERNRAT
jgi:hypothetical protein